MTPHIATGTLDDNSHAEDAKEYLLSNDFEETDIELIPAALGTAVIMNIATPTARLAQEAVDVLRNYGANGISFYEVV
ncbi:hypothetical protein [Mucilaginibacter terrenus]|nr:hypothetical protein [Mucilaginibacter terrenus]